jgi:hypothetical protein
MAGENRWEMEDQGRGSPCRFIWLLQSPMVERLHRASHFNAGLVWAIPDELELSFGR